MKNEVVTIDISEKLKEKGFREECYGYYGKNGDFFEIHPKQDINDSEHRCSAPTISQVLKWLRENNVDIVIRPIFVDGCREYTTEIYAPRYNKPYHIGNVSDWETAANTGIKYALEILI